MKKAILFAVMLLVALPCIASADFWSAVDKDYGKLNTIDYQSRGVFMTNTGTVINPVWTVVTPGTETIGDVWVGILSSITLRIDGSTDPAWKAGPGDYLTGYEVRELASDPYGANTRSYIAPTIDPFGHLNTTNGETLALFQKTSDWTPGTTVAAGVASAAVGSPLLTFSLASSLAGPEFSTDAGLLTVSFAHQQGLSGGAWPLSPAYSYDPYAYFDPPKTTLFDMGGTAVHQSLADASQWDFKGNGELNFMIVPEPGTLAIWGGLMMIGGVVGWRRRRK